MNLDQRIKESIRDVPDFPEKGIVFKDITPLLLDPELCKMIVEGICTGFEDQKIDAVCAIESRGFFIGMLIAQKLMVPFIPARKKGRLPGEVVEFAYELEYGKGVIEIHKAVIQKGWNVMIHDDLLATGGTAMAASQLVRAEGGNVAGYSFVVELDFLEGRKRILDLSEKIISLVHY